METTSLLSTSRRIRNTKIGNLSKAEAQGGAHFSRRRRSHIVQSIACQGHFRYDDPQRTALRNEKGRCISFEESLFALLSICKQFYPYQ